MKINTRIILQVNSVDLGFLFLLIVGFLARPEMRLVLTIGYIILHSVKDGVIYKRIHQQEKLFIFIFIIGILMDYYSGNNSSSHALIRYMCYTLSPIVYLYAGYITYQRSGIEKICKTIALASYVNIIWVIINLVIKIRIYGLGFDTLRDSKAYISQLMLCIIFIYIISEQSKFIISGYVSKCWLTLDAILLLITFSRTYFIELIAGFIVYTALFLNHKKYYKQMAIIAIILLTTLIVVLNNKELNGFFVDFIQKLVMSSTELSTNRGWDFYDINNSWRGYEVYMAQQQFLQSDILQKIFGHGARGLYVGTSISTIVSEAVTDGYLPVLHNGYYGMLTYAGVIGLILYLYFYFRKAILGIQVYKRLGDPFAAFIVIFVAMNIVSTYVIKGIVSAEGAAIPCLVIGSVYAYVYEIAHRSSIKMRIGLRNE